MEILKQKPEGIFRLYLEDDYVVEIIHEEEIIEFWLFNKSMGIKSFMFGFEDKNYSINKLIDFAIANIEEYISIYRQDYEEENLIEEFMKK